MTGFKRILLAVVWMLTFVGASGLAAAFIRPGAAWPLAIVAILLPGVCILLLASAFAAAAMRRWVPFGFAIVIVFMVTGRHVSSDRWSKPVPERNGLTVMSYNAPKEPDDEKARADVMALIARVEPDIIALQESVVWSMKRTPNILRTHRKFQHVIDSLRYMTAMPPEGGPPNARWTHWKPPVLLKFAPDRQQQFELGERGSDETASSLVRTELTWQNRKMAIYNVHLTSHGAHKPWQQPGGLFSRKAWARYLVEIKNGFIVRERQVKQIKEFMDEESLPVVLVGDFNSTPDSWTYFQLSDGLQDTYRLTGSGWGATYSANRPAVRIDFILLGPEFEPVNAFVANPYPSSSDHRPLVARFRWRKETK